MGAVVRECNTLKVEVGKLDKLTLVIVLGCVGAVGWIELAAAAALDWFKDQLEVDSDAARRTTLYAISAFCSRTTTVM